MGEDEPLPSKFPTGERNCIRERKRQRSRGLHYSVRNRKRSFALPFPCPPARFPIHNPLFCSFSREEERMRFLKSYRSGILVPWLAPRPRENLLPRFTARLTRHGPVSPPLSYPHASTYPNSTTLQRYEFKRFFPSLFLSLRSCSSRYK